jgi:hypothetical protein
MRIEQESKELNPAEIRRQLGALSRYLDCIEVVYD